MKCTLSIFLHILRFSYPNRKKNNMGSEGSINLPVIDFSRSELRTGSSTWDSVKSQVAKAAEEYGCFQALFNRIPHEQRKGMNGAMEELLQLPLETKQRNVSEKPFHGYLGSSSAKPSIYEGLCIIEPGIYDNVESFTNVLWPEGNIKIRSVSFSFLPFCRPVYLQNLYSTYSSISFFLAAKLCICSLNLWWN